MILSKYFGPCFGVSRAFETSMKIDSDVKIFGDIAHNKILIDKLKSKRNIKIIKKISEVCNNDFVIIRTHGITVNDMIELEKKNCKITDLTCCNVRFVQKIAEKAEKEGKILILAGHIFHSEVIGISSRCKNTFVVDSIESTKNFISNIKFDHKPIIVASQTTFDHNKFADICDFLKSKFNNIEIYDTICNDSYKRRDELKKISCFVDYCIVIGDKNSSNSMRLFEFSKNFCKSSIIENPKSLDVSILDGIKRLFITSGASVLKETVLELVNNIKKNREIEIKKVV